MVFDGTQEESFGPNYPAYIDTPIVSGGKQLGVGGAKNLGVLYFETAPKLQPNDIILFSDCDMYYLPAWDEKLEKSLLDTRFVNITQLGGWKHPYHETEQLIFKMIGMPYGVPEGVDAVTGNCFVIRYSDWKKYGPFDANALGPGQSEDYALSQKIKMAGGIVATLDPPVAIHCGMVNCMGQPATGWEEMSQMAEKQIEENKIDKVWLAVPEEGTILLERTRRTIPEVQSLLSKRKFSGLNVGSGQRRFETSMGWLNIDHCSRPPDQVPDVVCDATKLTTKFGEASQDVVVLHHVLEHFGCGEADEVIKQCYKVLRPGGSLLIFVPDLRKLAGRWLSGELEDFLFLVNVYGAFQGFDGDRHKWGYDETSLRKYLRKLILPLTPYCSIGLDPQEESSIISFDWREIPGADIACDWWILGMEIVK